MLGSHSTVVPNHRMGAETHIHCLGLLEVARECTYAFCLYYVTIHWVRFLQLLNNGMFHVPIRIYNLPAWAAR